MDKSYIANPSNWMIWWIDLFENAPLTDSSVCSVPQYSTHNTLVGLSRNEKVIKTEWSDSS